MCDIAELVFFLLLVYTTRDLEIRERQLEQLAKNLDQKVEEIKSLEISIVNLKDRLKSAHVCLVVETLVINLLP